MCFIKTQIQDLSRVCSIRILKELGKRINRLEVIEQSARKVFIFWTFDEKERGGGRFRREVNMAKQSIMFSVIYENYFFLLLKKEKSEGGGRGRN